MIVKYIGEKMKKRYILERGRRWQSGRCCKGGEYDKVVHVVKGENTMKFIGKITTRDTEIENDMVNG